MEEGIDVYDDFDDFDELQDLQQNVNTTTQDDDSQNDLNDQQDIDYSAPTDDIEDDIITSLLQSRGIEDKSRVKFVDDDGNIDEVSWDSLDNETKLNILQSSESNPEVDLDNSEIELINAIRQSRMSPAEYLQYIEQTGVNRYIENTQEDNYRYQVDQYSDDDLYVYDLMSRIGATEPEAQEMLEQAKANEALFSKQIGAIRQEYKDIEAENLRAAQIEQDQLAQEQYNQFAQSVAYQIQNFNTFADYDLNMDSDDMQELYEFLTGFDAAGNNHFAKTLTDPKLVVQMAWFALNGSRMIEDITDYYKNEITQVRKNSYAKGLEDARNGNNRQNVVYKNKQKPSKPVQNDYFDDFDDEF